MLALLLRPRGAKRRYEEYEAPPGSKQGSYRRHSSKSRRAVLWASRTTAGTAGGRMYVFHHQPLAKLKMVCHLFQPPLVQPSPSTPSRFVPERRERRSRLPVDRPLGNSPCFVHPNQHCPTRSSLLNAARCPAFFSACYDPIHAEGDAGCVCGVFRVYGKVCGIPASQPARQNNGQQHRFDRVF